MFLKVQKILEQQNMIFPGDKVLVGLSGGADSVALLLVLQELAGRMDFSLEAIHVEHGIRGEESQADERFAKELCVSCGIPFEAVNVNVPAFCQQTGLGTEEAARKLRYEVFQSKALEKGAKIALAHHQEDNAETILFQMIRGSSLTGLCGMQPVRKDENGVCYIRPLLKVHREEIEQYLKAKGKGYCIDSTNEELEYSRNFLRNQVIPELLQINEQAVEHMNQTATHLSEIKAYMDMETEKAWEQVAQIDERVSLDIKALLVLHPVMQRQLAYKAIILMAKQKKDISSVHVEGLLDLCKGQSGKRISLPYGIIAKKEFDIVQIWVSELDATESRNEQKEFWVSEEMLAEALDSGEKITVSFGDKGEHISCCVFERDKESLEILRKTYTKWLDYDKIKQGFCIRTRRSGDYFINDALGHRKKLKEYFIEEKIPLTEREKKWFLAQESTVLWLFGGRISEHVKVSQKTKYILQITYDGGN